MTCYTVGLTGGIAMGKTHVTDTLKTLGAYIVDADEISRSLTGKNGAALSKIRLAFGDGVFDDNQLNRKKLGQIVFQNGEKRKELESILHPMIFEEIDKNLSSCRDLAFLSVPLLYECRMDQKCDEVWCVYIPKDEQILRLMARDHCTREEALQRIESQMSSEEKKKRSQVIIPTGGTLEETKEIIKEKYLSLKNRLSL